jgi:hypothetical protein
MLCPICVSANQEEFPAEMMVHFSGRENLDRPGVMICPKILVCLNCGFSQFTAPKTELASPEKATPTVDRCARSDR